MWNLHAVLWSPSYFFKYKVMIMNLGNDLQNLENQRKVERIAEKIKTWKKDAQRELKY